MTKAPEYYNPSMDRAISGSTAVERQSQVSEQMGRINMGLDHLEKAIHKMGDRICPIMTMNGAGIVSNSRGIPEPEKPAIVQFAGMLRDQSDRLEVLVDILNGFINRVEL